MADQRCKRFLGGGPCGHFKDDAIHKKAWAAPEMYHPFESEDEAPETMPFRNDQTDEWEARQDAKIQAEKGGDATVPDNATSEIAGAVTPATRDKAGARVAGAVPSILDNAFAAESPEDIPRGVMQSEPVALHNRPKPELAAEQGAEPPLTFTLWLHGHRGVKPNDMPHDWIELGQDYADYLAAHVTKGLEAREFERPAAGEWVQPVEHGYLMKCCGCGLVHSLDFRVYEGRAQFRAFQPKIGAVKGLSAEIAAQIKAKIEAGEASQYEAAILWQELERLAEPAAGQVGAEPVTDADCFVWMKANYFTWTGGTVASKDGKISGEKTLTEVLTEHAAHVTKGLEARLDNLVSAKSAPLDGHGVADRASSDDLREALSEHFLGGSSAEETKAAGTNLPTGPEFLYDSHGFKRLASEAVNPGGIEEEFNHEFDERTKLIAQVRELTEQKEAAEARNLELMGELERARQERDEVEQSRVGFARRAETAERELAEARGEKQ